MIRRFHEALAPEKLQFSKFRGAHYVYKNGSRSILIPARVITRFDVVDTALHELLHLGRRGNVSDISPLRDLKKLEDLALAMTKVSDLSPLKGLKNLKWLDIRKTDVSDISPLEGLKNLKGVAVDCSVIGKNEEVVEKLRGRGVDV